MESFVVSLVLLNPKFTEKKILKVSNSLYLKGDVFGRTEISISHRKE